MTITNTYDDLGRIKSSTSVGAGTVTYNYTARGITNVVDALGKTNWFVFNELERKTSETNAIGERIEYSYNEAGDLRTLKDGKDQLTSWGYDSEGRVTSKTNAASVEIFRYKYDANGQLTNRWTAAKGDTWYTVNAGGNITLVNYTNSTDIQMGYDALNRLTNMVDAVGTSV
ncbi:MAG: hypothetical protein SFY81_07765, partial [Verrucomicrobiota bacterium]|nr:hypothetical protein [Verrucomicrobiota bacterium]